MVILGGFLHFETSVIVVFHYSIKKPVSWGKQGKPLGFFIYFDTLLKGKVLDVFNLKENEAHLELHGYKMINTHDGSRLTEFDEKPDFYDVSVLFYNDKSGEIDPVEEFEDVLTFDKANIIMGALEKKYKSISLFGEWVN